MKVLLKLTQIFFALLCMANVSRACGDAYVAEQKITQEMEDLSKTVGDLFLTPLVEACGAWGKAFLNPNHDNGDTVLAQAYLDSTMPTELKIASILELCNEIQSRKSAEEVADDYRRHWRIDLYGLVRKVGKVEEVHALLNTVYACNKETEEIIMMEMQGNYPEVTKGNIIEFISELRTRVESITDRPRAAHSTAVPSSTDEIPADLDTVSNPMTSFFHDVYACVGELVSFICG